MTHTLGEREMTMDRNTALKIDTLVGSMRDNAHHKGAISAALDAGRNHMTLSTQGALAHERGEYERACHDVQRAIRKLLGLDKGSGDKWGNDEIQFARLIEELNAVGAFTDEVVQGLCVSMDLEPGHIEELIDRATVKWEGAKND